MFTHSQVLMFVADWARQRYDTKVNVIYIFRINYGTAAESIKKNCLHTLTYTVHTCAVVLPCIQIAYISPLGFLRVKNRTLAPCHTLLVNLCSPLVSLNDIYYNIFTIIICIHYSGIHHIHYYYDACDVIHPERRSAIL